MLVLLPSGLTDDSSTSAALTTGAICKGCLSLRLQHFRSLAGQSAIHVAAPRLGKCLAAVQVMCNMFKEGCRCCQKYGLPAEHVRLCWTSCLQQAANAFQDATRENT